MKSQLHSSSLLQIATRGSAGIVVAILAATGLAKAVVAMGTSPVLGALDPLTGFTWKSTFMLIGAVEVAVATAIILTRDVLFRAVLMLWIGGCFAGYRIWMWASGFSGPCKCLGSLPELAGLSDESASVFVSICLAAIFFSGGLGIICHIARPSRAP